MSDLLRIYKPSECGADGVPLDWERCRTCGGEPDRSITACLVCHGHGSLKAAVLAELEWRDEEYVGIALRTRAVVPAHVHRCASCSHPMSEGTWEGDTRGLTKQGRSDRALAVLRAGREPDDAYGVHYSACDSLCDHGEPFRYRVEDNDWDYVTTTGSPVRGVRVAGEMVAARGEVEASWRPVDIRVGMVAKRTLGDRFDPGNVLQVRPFDLTRENVSVMCLRCWAAPI